MVDAVTTALRFVDGKDRDDLDEDEMLVLALTSWSRSWARPPSRSRPRRESSTVAVPWSAAARMRDRLVHHYFDIDLDVLWSTVESDLPVLPSVLPRPDAEESI